MSFGGILLAHILGFYLILILSVGIPRAEGVLGLMAWIYILGTALPTISVTVRRLHDTGRSGWNYLWYLLPAFGFLVMLFLLVGESESGTNEYGEPEKYPNA